MLKFKFDNYLVAVFIVVSGLALGSYAGGGGGGDVVYKRLQWDCRYAGEHRHCEIAFALANKTPVEQMRRVNIRAVRMSAGKTSSEALICGQMQFSVLLKPGEVLDIREKIWVTAMPDKIRVSIME